MWLMQFECREEGSPLTNIPTQNHSSALACSILSFIGIIGIFNRITFPAFIVIAALQLVPHFFRKYVPRPPPI